MSALSAATDRDFDAARGELATLDAAARRIDTEGADGSMAWREWGEGPALVFLHGGSGSWNHWVRNVPAFARERRVIAGNLPGLGDSPDPREPYSAESLAGIVSDGIDALVEPGEPFDLVGFSFGGILSGHIAYMQARRIRSVTIVGSPAFGMPSTGPANDIEPVAPELSFDVARPLHERNLARLMFADPGQIDALALVAHHENLRRARLRSRKIARTDTLARALERVRCPVHGVWGNEDVAVHPSVEGLRELFLGLAVESSFDVRYRAGHWIAYEDAAWFNGTLAARLGIET